MAPKHLLEIALELQPLYDRLCDGFDTDEEVDAELERVMSETSPLTPTHKVESCAAIDAMLEGRLAEAKVVRDRLTDIVSRLERSRTGLRRRLLDECLEAGLRRCRTLVGTVQVRTSSKVRISDEEAIPREYIRVKETPDKRKIREALKRGVEVPGAELEKTHGIAIVGTTRQ